MGIEKDKINDIVAPEEGAKIHPIDLLVFFPRANLKAIRLNQSSLFSDLYLELNQTVDVTKRKIIKLTKLYKEDFSDIISKKHHRLSLMRIIKRHKPRILVDPVSIIEPIGYVIRNVLDIRAMETLPINRTYPDIYILPLLSKQGIKDFYSNNRIVIKKGLSRGAIGLLIMSIIVVALGLLGIGYKNYLQAELTKGYQEIYAFKTIQDPKILQENANKISARFSKLEFLFSPANLIGNNFIYSNSSIKLAKNIITGGKQIADIASIGGKIWQDFESEKSKTLQGKMVGLSSLSGIQFSEFFKNEESNLANIDGKLKKAINYYAQVESLGNTELDTKFQSTLENLMKGEKYISFVLKNKEMLLNLMGDTKPMRYFILNQNKDEIRANGGFPGSVTTLELYKGSVLTYDKKDIYYYDWHLTPYQETPPEGLNIISPNHGLRDANYSPIFLDSVKKINFFYEKAGGGTIDTVIGINQGLIEDFLAKYGPVYLDEIGADITDKNFSLIMSVLVENKFQKVVSPKDILFKFSENFEKKLFEKKDFTGYFEILLNNLIAGEIPIASRDADVQKYIDSLGLLEKWRQDKGNWIYPVFTSISGNKSDRYISRRFTLKSAKIDGCKVNNEFELISTHNFNDNTQETIRQVFDELKITDSVERDRLMGIEGAGENRQFVRVLVPKGSTLNNAYGNSVNIDNSNPNYMFLKFYTKTAVANSSVIKFNYTSIPSNCTEKPIFYKQPGLSNYIFSGD